MHHADNSEKIQFSGDLLSFVVDQLFLDLVGKYFLLKGFSSILLERCLIDSIKSIYIEFNFKAQDTDAEPAFGCFPVDYGTEAKRIAFCFEF